MAEISPNIVTQTFLAAGDLSAHQYNIMRISDANTVNVCSLATTVQMVGVLANQPAAAGRHASVVTDGERYKVRAGAAISSAGLFLTCNGSGRAIAAASNDVVFGRSLDIATADGDIISYMPNKPFRLSGAAT